MKNQKIRSQCLIKNSKNNELKVEIEKLLIILEMATVIYDKFVIN